MSEHSERLLKVLDENLSKIKAISPDLALSKPNLKKWSRKELLGHLIDSAANNHQRFVRIQRQE